MSEVATQTTLICNRNDCGGMMRLSRGADESAIFTCQRCEQTVWLLRDGGFSQRIMPRIYPSDVSRWPAAMHHEWVEYEVAQRLFIFEARGLVGLTTTAEAAKIRADLVRQAVEYKAAHPLPDASVLQPPRRRPWWRFW